MPLVDIIGVAGFVLSLLLAIYQVITNRLSIKLDKAVLIDSYKQPESLFLYVCFSNRTRAQFSLTDIQLIKEKRSKPISFEKTVRTYAHPRTEDKAEVKPVVLSQAFPVRFDSYASQVLVLEVSRQHIHMKDLPLGDPGYSLKERIHKLLHHTDTSDTHPPRPRLVLHTSRGRRAVDLCVKSIESWDWLEDYAVHKAAYENKIEFP